VGGRRVHFGGQAHNARADEVGESAATYWGWWPGGYFFFMVRFAGLRPSSCPLIVLSFTVSRPVMLVG